MLFLEVLKVPVVIDVLLVLEVLEVFRRFLW